MSKRVDKAVEEIMQKINSDKCASPDVTPEESVEFYESIAEMCNENARTIRGEHGID